MRQNAIADKKNVIEEMACIPPKWGVSTSLGPLLYISRVPEVSEDRIILRKYFLTTV